MVNGEGFHELINRLLNEADAAFREGLLHTAQDKAAAVLAVDSNNAEAQSIMEAVEQALTGWDYKGPDFPTPRSP